MAASSLGSCRKDAGRMPGGKFSGAPSPSASTTRLLFPNKADASDRATHSSLPDRGPTRFGPDAIVPHTRSQWPASRRYLKASSGFIYLAKGLKLGSVGRPTGLATTLFSPRKGAGNRPTRKQSSGPNSAVGLADSW